MLYDANMTPVTQVVLVAAMVHGRLFLVCEVRYQLALPIAFGVRLLCRE